MGLLRSVERSKEGIHWERIADVPYFVYTVLPNLYLKES
jgi:hypothetical protein